MGCKKWGKLLLSSVVVLSVLCLVVFDGGDISISVAFSAAPSSGENSAVGTDSVPQLTAEEEKAWKAEPMYGKALPYAFFPSNCVGACRVAEILGFYEEEGLKVDCVKSTHYLDATATGNTVLCEAHIAESTVPILNGLELVMVGTAMSGCQSLYVLNESDYKKTTDLVGKNVAIPQGFGTFDHNIVLRFMGRDGLKMSDYNFKVVERSAVVQALQRGEISASLLPDMFAYQFLADGIIRPIRSLTWDEDFNQDPCCTIILNKTFAEENPITAKKMTRALAKASAWIDTHTEESVQLMLDNGMMSLSDPRRRDKLVELQGSYDWTITNVQCENALRSVLDDYKGFKLINPELDTEKTLLKIWRPTLTDEELKVVWAQGAAFDANN